MKDLIRGRIKEKMKLLTFEELRKKSEKICWELSENYLDQAQNICIYVSKDFEIETHNLIKELLKIKNVLVPFVENNKLKISQIHDFSDLKKGKFDILEPGAKEEFQGNIDLILVPGIAFDQKGNRLGRGQGYYDKFLKNINGLKVGLAFDEQIIDDLPVEEHDIPLNLIITDKQIIKYN